MKDLAKLQSRKKEFTPEKKKEKTWRPHVFIKQQKSSSYTVAIYKRKNKKEKNRKSSLQIPQTSYRVLALFFFLSAASKPPPPPAPAPIIFFRFALISDAAKAAAIIFACSLSVEELLRLTAAELLSVLRQTSSRRLPILLGVL